MESAQNMIPPGNPGMSRIVVGVHGTTASDAALDWAVGEARLRRARLHLVLASDPGARQRAPYARPVARADTGPDTLADAALRTARMLPPGWVTAELANGLPARVLISSAAGAGLLVLGSARAAGPSSGAVGPVARACLRHAPCPVVVVAESARCAAAVRVPFAREPAGRLTPSAGG
jgi:nucleotide-binding universal stress UspA family protein